jgi:two-component sensor histidine kinase
MEPQIISSLAQFGAAGLIAWMWLTERRAAADREKQLTEAHEHLTQERLQLSTLISVVQDNTRALTAIETGQRSLAATLHILTRSHTNTNTPI